MTAVPDYLLDWAAEPGPRTVLAAARARLEGRGLGPRAVLPVQLTPAERKSVGRLLPARWTPSRADVSIKELRAGLGEHGVTLEDLVVAVSGPLRDREAEAVRAAAAEDERVAALASLVDALHVPLTAPLHTAAADALGRLVLGRAPARERSDAVLRVVQALPASGDVSLAVFAAAEFADAHALDRSRPLGRAVARFLAVRAAVVGARDRRGEPDGHDPEGRGEQENAALVLEFVDPLSAPESWRAAWASGGVTCDEVSAQVLVLNLPLVGEASAVRQCAASPGEPTWLTLRALRGRFALAQPCDVFVCENPSIVEAAAAAFGTSTHPLICTFGRPSTAAWELLRGLGPARLHVRADEDATGWSIVNAVLAAFPDADGWSMHPDSGRYEEELVEELLNDLRVKTPT